MSTKKTFEVAADDAGMRLDQVIPKHMPGLSRRKARTVIDLGGVFVDRARVKVAGRPVKPGQVIEVNIGGAFERAKDVALEPVLAPRVVHTDDHLIVVDKPAGLVVHPAVGNRSGTLLNGLLAHCPELAQLPRGGIVHRIDKDTSGLLVVAKTLSAHQELVAQLQQHSVTRRYDAVVQGAVTAGGTVDAPLGRHPVQRQKRAVVDASAADARPAVTHYRIRTRFRSHTHLSLQLETGRTHQIRVHMAHIGFPIVGDPVYGGRMKAPKGAAPDLLDFLQRFRRQALHARVLGFEHPESGAYVEWESPLPADFTQLLTLLERDRV